MTETLERTTIAPSLLVMMEFVKIAIPEGTVLREVTMTVEEVDVALEVVAVVIMTVIAEQWEGRSFLKSWSM